MSELYWVNGESFSAIDPNLALVKPNFETFWVDGYSGIELLDLADTYPYTPPPPQPAPDASPWGSETYWIDGYTSEGFVKDPEIINTNFETYWSDGFSAIYIYPIVDSYPYTPPAPQPLAYASFYGGETFWSDGISNNGIKTSLFNHTGLNSFWIDGSPADNIFDKDNYDTGKYNFIFDE